MSDTVKIKPLLLHKSYFSGDNLSHISKDMRIVHQESAASLRTGVFYGLTVTKETSCYLATWPSRRSCYHSLGVVKGVFVLPV